MIPLLIAGALTLLAGMVSPYHYGKKPLKDAAAISWKKMWVLVTHILAPVCLYYADAWKNLRAEGFGVILNSVSTLLSGFLAAKLAVFNNFESQSSVEWEAFWNMWKHEVKPPLLACIFPDGSIRSFHVIAHLRTWLVISLWSEGAVFPSPSGLIWGSRCGVMLCSIPNPSCWLSMAKEVLAPIDHYWPSFTTIKPC